MQATTVVTIPDRYTARGITFMPNGQQLTLGLPAGDYHVIGECDVCYSDLGQSKRTRAYQLLRAGTSEYWYVSTQVGQYLLAEHAKAPEGWTSVDTSVV